MATESWDVPRGKETVAFATYLRSSLNMENHRLAWKQCDDAEERRVLKLLYRDARKLQQKALDVLNRQKYGYAYRPHWLELPCLDNRGFLVFVLRLAEQHLQGFAQYYMIRCVSQSFCRQFKCVAFEWASRCLTVDKRFQTNWLAAKDYYVARDYYRSTKYTEFDHSTFDPIQYEFFAKPNNYCLDHPQTRLISVGSVVTHLELNFEHMEQAGSPSRVCPGTRQFLGEEFTQMMNQLPEPFAQDLFEWAAQTDKCKKLLVYFVHESVHVFEKFFWVCPLVHIETMMQPAFQEMFPIEAASLLNLVNRKHIDEAKPTVRSYDHVHISRDDVNNWLEFEDLNRAVEFCNTVWSEKRRFAKGLTSRTKTCKQHPWFASTRAVLWDFTPINLDDKLMTASNMCLFKDTQQHLETLLAPSVSGAMFDVKGLLTDSVHVIPEIMLDMKTAVFSGLWVRSNRVEAAEDMVLFQFKVNFLLCNRCLDEEQEYKHLPLERPKSRCCMRCMIYANYTWDEQPNDPIQDPAQPAQLQYTNDFVNI